VIGMSTSLIALGTGHSVMRDIASVPSSDREGMSRVELGWPRYHVARGASPAGRRAAWSIW
jgi:hypothetical protein